MSQQNKVIYTTYKATGQTLSGIIVDLVHSQTVELCGTPGSAVSIILDEFKGNNLS